MIALLCFAARVNNELNQIILWRPSWNIHDIEYDHTL